MTERNLASEVVANIEYLEAQAESILQAKKNRLSRRPIVIEFCGTPKAGKSSCIGSLATFLKRNGFRVKVLVERAGSCPIGKKVDPNFNIWTGSSVLMDFAEILSNHPKDYDVVMLDRGLFDAVCWFRWQLLKKKVDRNNYDIFVNFFLAPRWWQKIDILYIFKADSSSALDREYSNLLTRRRGTVMNEDVLHEYNTAADACVDDYGSGIRRIEHIDTSDLDQNQVSYQVTSEILRVLDELVSEEVGYFKLSADLSDLPEVFSFEELVSRAGILKFDQRATVEASERRVQPIPVGVITDGTRSKVLSARKMRARVSEKSAELNKDLLYFGGHVRNEDSGKDLPERFSQTLTRELKEELDIDFAPVGIPTFCIWDRSNKKSAKHIALVYVCEVDDESMRGVVADKKEFSEKTMKVLEKPANLSSILKPERWSEIIAERILEWPIDSRLL